MRAKKNNSLSVSSKDRSSRSVISKFFKLLLVGSVSFTALIVLLTIGFSMFIRPGFVSRYVETNYSRVEFPDIDQSKLSENSKKLLTILATEHNKDPRSFDRNVLKYTQGVEEPWCADFVSWVYMSADMPLKNPHSGSWRIPGTQTLKKYYIDSGSWQVYDNSYQPEFGDVVIYKIIKSPFGQHTNIVLENKSGQITTIGGNEFGRVAIQNFKITDQMGIDGYGKINLSN